MWFNMYTATPGSMQGQKERGRARRNPRTNYQAMFRSGSHQSATRGWLKPTLMTDSLVRKGLFGQASARASCPMSHCPTGPRANPSSRSRAPNRAESKELFGVPLLWASGRAMNPLR
ncbi:MAG: hypothetical protein IPJ07_18030 [Acidobacteria bacterium]|nr:hypothetical protein [Acidobacteriota bacterium]